MEDLSTDQSSGDTPTSGISSAISTAGEWDTVLSSIQKISGDLQEVWSHIGPRPRPLSYLSYQSKLDCYSTLNRNPINSLYWLFRSVVDAFTVVQWSRAFALVVQRVEYSRKDASAAIVVATKQIPAFQTFALTTKNIFRPSKPISSITFF